MWIPVSAAFAASTAVVDCKLSGSGESIFLASVEPIFNNGLPSLPRNLPDWTILDICDFDNFTPADELLAKDLQLFKLVYQLVIIYEGNYGWAIIFDDSLKVTAVPFFVADFNISSSE